MQIEQNRLYFSTSNQESGYIDLARCLTAVNGKQISQTKRRDGKYIPLAYSFRIRAVVGDISVRTLSCGYPTRNSVVLAGVARDAMLKSAGIPRSNLESYQKELRIKFEDGAGGASQYMPNCSSKGNPSGSPQAFGTDTYDYTKIVIADPDGAPDGLTKGLAMLGNQNASDANWDADGSFYVVDNWLKYRKSLTPQASTDDTANNVFSWAMQQSDTASDIIDLIDDEADDKPYNLSDFTNKALISIVGTNVGNPVSGVITAPLGLLKMTTGTGGNHAWEIEVIGVSEL